MMCDGSLWGSPISGASMNPARTFGPDAVGANFTEYWVYVAGPLTGALIAVGAAFALQLGRGTCLFRSSPRERSTPRSNAHSSREHDFGHE